ncbi:MAG: hypothetical protein C0501_28025 [Isosphaera sp.]|nr:hypothetical protein [Isosphaera sp.]
MLAVLAPAAVADPPPGPGTVAPAGGYHVAELTLEKAWFGDADLPVRLGLRDGKVVAAWFLTPERISNGQRMWVRRVTAAVAGDRLTGEVAGRRCTAGTGGVIGDFALALDARVADGRLTGTYRLALTALGEGKSGFPSDPREAAGRVGGRVRDEDGMRRANGLAAGKDWPDYFGAGGLGGPPGAAALVDDLAAARPVWVSEDPVPTAWGDAADGRYKSRVLRVGLCGGASTPVVSGGRVYQFYYTPSGPLADEARLAGEAAALSPDPVERRWYLDWHRPYADDVVVSIDAATGKTVWKTTLPGRDFNNQTHKWRGLNPTPAVAGGRVYVVNYATRVYALDERTGDLVWEYPAAPAGPPAGPMAAHGTGPVVLGDVVVAPLGVVTGLDARTGKVRWTGPKGRPLGWTHAGKHHVIVSGPGPKGDPANRLTCLDAATGKELWATPANVVASSFYLAFVAGDRLITVRPDEAAAGKGMASPAVVCYRLAPDGAEIQWTQTPRVPVSNAVEYGMAVLAGRLYVNGTADALCLDLETGKVLASVKGVGGGPGHLTVGADGRLLILRDGAHGSQTFQMVNADPAAFKPLGGPWSTANPPTSAYHGQPLGFPLVDGRLFVRGPGGIYCYDLRAPAE